MNLHKKFYWVSYMTESREGSHKPPCFGILDKVFPMGKHGLREVVPACYECQYKKECLQKALETRDGLEFRSEIIDRFPAEGVVGWLKKWSERKILNSKINKKSS